jgi:type II secretory pathway pseudopilin PulG
MRLFTGAAMRSIHAQRRNGEAGFTLIDMLFVVSLICLLMTLAIPGLMRARGAAQVSSAIGTMRVVNSAQLSYAITCGSGFYAPDLGTLGVKPPGALDSYLPDDLSGAPTFIKSGYNFSMAGTGIATAPPTCNGLKAGAASTGYAVVADPLDSSPPARFLGSNSDGLIYEHTSSLALIMTEAGRPASGTPLQ